MKFLDKKGLIQISYCLIRMDGAVAKGEMDAFDELGGKIDRRLFDLYRDQYAGECDAFFDGIAPDEEYYYDIIMEYADKLIERSNVLERLSSRFVIWNLLVISVSDGNIDPEESRLIHHIARVLDVPKSIYLELEQYLKTGADIDRKINWYKSSDRPYSEIAPLIEELEKRQQTILEAAGDLIEDEVFDIENRALLGSSSDITKVKENSGKTSAITEKADDVVGTVKTVVTDTVLPAAADIGGKIKKGVFSAAKAVGDKSSVLIKKNSPEGKEES